MPKQKEGFFKGLGIRGTLGLIALIVACGFIGFNFWKDSQFKEGACLDYYPSGLFDYNPDANVVDCDSTDARSKIIAVHDTGDGECPARATATLSDDDTVYCLVQV